MGSNYQNFTNSDQDNNRTYCQPISDFSVIYKKR
jgi:hypothetical protein